MSITQYHLKGKGHSGRGVRVRELDPAEVEANAVAAAKMLGTDATLIEFQKTIWRNAVKMMITEITEPCDDVFAEGVKWKKVSGGMLENLGDYFKAKDVQLLESVYRSGHELNPAELEDITKKAVPVSEG